MIMQSKQATASKAGEMIGEAVRQSREALGLRQDELALAAGVSTRVIHQIEHGKPTSRLDSLAPVLAVLGLDLQVGPRDPGVAAAGGGQ
jgi:HTH-type transcriptional regulator / antitoxin HipB